MKPTNAVAISRAANAPSLGLNGGSIYGIPVVTSSVGDRLTALDAAHCKRAMTHAEIKSAR
jgi:hypothetical protein